MLRWWKCMLTLRTSLSCERERERERESTAQIGYHGGSINMCVFILSASPLNDRLLRSKLTEAYQREKGKIISGTEEINNSDEKENIFR